MPQPSATRAPNKHVILFLAANPSDTGRLALDREARAIQVALERSRHRDRFELVTRWATEPDDLLRELRERSPTVVHFSGHGVAPAATVAPAQRREVVVTGARPVSARGGVVVNGADGRSQVLTPEAIAKAFDAAGAQAQLVYSWRDYFRGARRLGEAGLRAGYVSRVLLSESEGIWAFGIAAPVYDHGAWIGVLLTTIGTDAALGQQRLDRASDDGPMAVIVAPRDRSRATAEGEGDYVVVLHDGLTHGAGITMDSPQLRALRATRTEQNQVRWIDPDPITDEAHRDPVPGFEGRWLAGLAPVGDTGFVVIVQTRNDAALQPNTRLSRRFVQRGSVVILAWLAVCLVGLWAVRCGRRRRPAPTCAP
jgi:hypothetical protein